MSETAIIFTTVSMELLRMGKCRRAMEAAWGTARLDSSDSRPILDLDDKATFSDLLALVAVFQHFYLCQVREAIPRKLNSFLEDRPNKSPDVVPTLTMKGM